ncbi:hypothetical protein [Agaribacterium haliotis]|uniref:hypothetical protein n=1 Tax=Agaribacterium haliotis TaxID=2013869 RepID=UPI000BB58159|nr:hypothetical protein [Agaribacterium haliotis]
MNISKTTIKATFTGLSCALAACASSPKPAYSEFLTRMSDSGLKHFELRFMPEPKAKNKKQAGRGQRPSSGNPKKAYRKAREQMLKEADRQIAQNHYCREGFWVMSFESSGRAHRLRGECNELASAADREQFPQTLKNW